MTHQPIPQKRQSRKPHPESPQNRVPRRPVAVTTWRTAPLSLEQEQWAVAALANLVADWLAKHSPGQSSARRDQH